MRYFVGLHDPEAYSLDECHPAAFKFVGFLLKVAGLTYMTYTKSDKSEEHIVWYAPDDLTWKKYTW